MAVGSLVAVALGLDVCVAVAEAVVGDVAVALAVGVALGVGAAWIRIWSPGKMSGLSVRLLSAMISSSATP